MDAACGENLDMHRDRDVFSGSTSIFHTTNSSLADGACACAQLCHQHILQGVLVDRVLIPCMLPQRSVICAQVRVWVPAAVMRRAQARMVQGTGPEASGLTLMLRSDFYESRVPLQV